MAPPVTPEKINSVEVARVTPGAICNFDVRHASECYKIVSESLSLAPIIRNLDGGHARAAREQEKEGSNFPLVTREGNEASRRILYPPESRECTCILYISV